MNFTRADMEKLSDNWAVSVFGAAERDRAFEVANARLVSAAVSGQMTLDFFERPDDTDLLDRLATAYEFAAIEGLGALLSSPIKEQDKELQRQAQAAASRAFDLRRAIEPPPGDDRLFHFLRLAALAYCGDRWPDLRRWMQDNRAAIEAQVEEGATWDRRVLQRLYDCWLRLFRKSGWHDLNEVTAIVGALRRDQLSFENDLLDDLPEANAPAVAMRLVALYHWAKASEQLATYMLQGEPADVLDELDHHFEAGRSAAAASGDVPLDIILRWLHAAARRMAAGSLWHVARTVRPQAANFVQSVTRSGSLFELLPPQRAAIQEQGLLDVASRAVVVDLPTSGGKTVLAEFRILQALNQFESDSGWVAYVAPTRALVSQITRRLRRDLEPIGIRVEQMSAAVELDSFEQSLLAAGGENDEFHVLVATPEKLSLVIRNHKLARPLALLVLDEAQNIEDEERGLRIELLLATVKRDSPAANFLLLMPNVPNAEELTRWLAAPDSGKTVSLGTSPWQPNERIVGMYQVQKGLGRAGDWSLQFETLVTTPKTIHLTGTHRVDGNRPIRANYSSAKGSLSRQTAAMAKVFSERGTSIAVGRTIPNVWSMAREIANSIEEQPSLPEEVSLVQRFLATEISSNFELISLLSKGVAVHHSGLSDEARSLVEWLAETNKIRVLCATTTIAQGINFPVSSVFLATTSLPISPPKPQRHLSQRMFWNLAGRAGRINQDSVGVVGLAAGPNPSIIIDYVSRATQDLVSRLTTMLDEVDNAGSLLNLELIIREDQWSDFRSYVAHLWTERQNLDAVLADAETLLRNTFGYESLQLTTNNGREKATALLLATRAYARVLADTPEAAQLADATGFAPEGVLQAFAGLGRLERKLTLSDWQPDSLFGDVGKTALPQLIGVMMRIPQIRDSLQQISTGGDAQRYVALVAQAWVMGKSIEDIANDYFMDSKSKSFTEAVTAACQAVYRNLAIAGTWGLSALSKMPTSGINFNELSVDERRLINNLPAMLYHGVRSEAAILMRMNAVPRSVAERLGEEMTVRTNIRVENQTVRAAREFLRSLTESEWQRAAPVGSVMTGSDYRSIWRQLAGEAG